MFTVGNMRRALAGLDDEEPIAVVFFLKSDAEDNIGFELTKEQWADIAETFHSDDGIDTEATTLIKDIVFDRTVGPAL